MFSHWPSDIKRSMINYVLMARIQRSKNHKKSGNWDLAPGSRILSVAKIASQLGMCRIKFHLHSVSRSVCTRTKVINSWLFSSQYTLYFRGVTVEKNYVDGANLRFKYSKTLSLRSDAEKFLIWPLGAGFTNTLLMPGNANLPSILLRTPNATGNEVVDLVIIKGSVHRSRRLGLSSRQEFLDRGSFGALLLSCSLTPHVIPIVLVIPDTFGPDWK